jgi:hypothetical protein
MVQPSAESQDWERTLHGLHFPLSLDELMKRAREVGGVDSEVHRVIGRLHDDSFESLDELVQAVREIYLADGIPADKLPV